MALGEIKINDILKIIWKEFRVSILVGIALAVVNFIRVYFVEKTDIMVTITVCVSLIITVMLAKVIGSMLPVAAKSLKLDPAIMASPLITTVVDVMSLIAYFTIATWLMGLK